jgi:hypothetical protein
MSEDKVQSEQKIPERPQRVPLHDSNVLTADQRPGYRRRFVNDVGDRIAKFEQAGWVVVRGDAGAFKDRTGKASQLGEAVRKPVGGGMNAVLMEIPEEYYTEDQNAVHNKVKDQLDGFDSSGQLSGRRNRTGSDVKIG